LAINQLKRLYIEPTNRCNLDCRTCMRHGWEEPLGFMAADLWRKILRELSIRPQKPEIFFGGFGEPLAHPEIVGMVAQAKKSGCPVELISNGILLDAEMADSLSQAGLDRLWVSIDGARPESYADVRLADHLPLIMANLERMSALSETTRLGISFVAMKRNLADLPAVLELAHGLGADRFSLSNIEPYTAAMEGEILYQKSRFIPLPAGACLVPRFDADVLSVEVEKKIKKLFPDALESVPLAPGRTGFCPFWQRCSAALRWDGQLGPCLPLLHAHTVFLDGYSRDWDEFHFGSLAHSSLESIWNKPWCREFRAKLDEFAFAPCATCNSCSLPALNGEDCFGNAHPACGGCLWSQGFIRCP